MRYWLPIVLALLPGMIGTVLGLAAAAGIVFAGSIFVFRFQASPALIAPLTGWIVSALVLPLWWFSRRRDRTLQEALAREQLAREEHHRRFIHHLNHELKNPLTAIRAGLANLEDEGRLDPAARSSLQTVRGQVERLARLADDLRKLTDLETRTLDHVPVNLSEVVTEAVDLIHAIPDWDGRRVTVDVQRVPWQLSPIQGDHDLLVLALYNLLNNALKFSTPDATVELRAREDGSWSIVEVADTGRGILADDLPHVTEELYRGQDARGTEGSGLGLALADRVTRLHGGRLVIRSREREGTVVTLRLPSGQK
ncbi:sensor histidine kinase [Nitrolancea hollandica]|uniref:histidine kinase n=1 Tax=Nitrolancea hollandica Lb TaxID=1129897 RepID=I4ELV9_9BACT|nr:HAMP domain-containing sensor histidine kinase [Nitrolancea hollandica]CCF85672.1 putative Sensor protein [Nitrolancea hollandica Lb]